MSASALPRVSRLEVLRSRKEILANPLPFHHRHFEALGNTFMIDILLGGKVIFTRDPEIIRHILQKNHKNYRKSDLQTKEMARYIGKGILTAEGDHWRTHRRMIQPAFHRKQLANLLDTMDAVVEQELKSIRPEATMDIYPLVSDLAFQVVAQALFSRPDIRERMHRLQELTESNQRMLIREMRQPYLKWWFKLRGTTSKHLGYAREGRNLLNTIIEERIGSGKKEHDLLDMLLEARYEDGTAMSREQLIDEVLILFTAGHETTANVLSYVLFLLARHPGEQEKLYREAVRAEAVATPLERIRASSFAKQCIEEAMRLYPPVYVIDRVAREADEVAGVHLRKGSLVLMSLYELHRNETLWEDATAFRPDRFDPDKGSNFNAHYFPFGAGPRMCIGNNFAMYEMTLVLNRLIKRYRIETLQPAISLNPLISLKPKDVMLQFYPRQ